MFLQTWETNFDFNWDLELKKYPIILEIFKISNHEQIEETKIEVCLTWGVAVKFGVGIWNSLNAIGIIWEYVKVFQVIKISS